MDRYENIREDLLKDLDTRSEIDDLEIIKGKIENIEEFLINYTKGNYIRYLKLKIRQKG